MKAWKKETTCLPGISDKCSAKAYVNVPVKWKTDVSKKQESVIKNGKGKRNCLLDGEKRSVHSKARGDSLEMEKSEGSQPCSI